MAVKESELCISLEASTDLSANQFHFVQPDTNGQLELTGDGGDAIGVLQNDPDAQGRVGKVAIMGRVKVEAGGTITAGDDVASNATGEAVSAATGDIVLGRALESGTDGSIIAIVFQKRGSFA